MSGGVNAGRIKAFIPWLTVILLFLGSGWTLNISIANWWAASFHDEHRQVYTSRGNIFFIVALALFAASVSVIVATLRSGKRRRMAKA